MIARIKVITHPRIRLKAGMLAPHEAFPQRSAGGAIRLVAIGASTGGPAAIADILRALPRRFPVPIAVVLHISEQFAFALAEWLGTQSRIPVRNARDGEPLPPVGEPAVLLAPAGRHLRVERGRFRLTDEAERFSCRPSVDVLFESVGNDLGAQAVLCLLTGMGKDGAAGLLRARRQGALTIAQDEASSVIYGMPGEAARIGAAAQILPLDQIASCLIGLAGVNA
jgi:two-component system chemotaxis response regulator CheB